MLPLLQCLLSTPFTHAHSRLMVQLRNRIRHLSFNHEKRPYILPLSSFSLHTVVGSLYAPIWISHLALSCAKLSTIIAPLEVLDRPSEELTSAWIALPLHNPIPRLSIPFYISQISYLYLIFYWFCLNAFVSFDMQDSTVVAHGSETMWGEHSAKRDFLFVTHDLVALCAQPYTSSCHIYVNHS